MTWSPRTAAMAAVLGVVSLTASGIPRSAAPLASAPRVAHAALTIDDTLKHDAEGCAGVRSTVWHPLSGIEYTGRIRVHLPAHPAAGIVLFIGDVVPLTVEAASPAGEPITLKQEHLPPGPGLHVPPDFWLEDNDPWAAPREVTRVSLDAAADHQGVVILSLGRRAPRVLARLTGYPPEVRVAVCAEPVRGPHPVFAAGWTREERRAGEAIVRRMQGYGAVLVASISGRAARVRLSAAPLTPSGAVILSLLVNDVFEADPVTMREGVGDYEWSIPDRAWVAGTNELFFRTQAGESIIVGELRVDEP